MAQLLNETIPPRSRPAPVFNSDPHSFSTKKERCTPKFVPPPKPHVKSCPLPRIPSNIQHVSKPLPVSFRITADSSFIAQSPIYKAHNSESYFEQCYNVEAKLGVGSFGEVFRVRSKEDGKVYACKKTLYKFRGETDRRRKMAEVAKHEKLPKHRNCVQFYRAWEENQRLFILTEACQQSLASLAEQRKEALPEHELWEYLLDLLQGAAHLHAHSLVHMDIKPENIFLTSDGVCKLGDFGLMFDLSGDNPHEVIEGDPRYLAPECLSSECCGPPADMFSLGMTVLELATDLDLPTQGAAWHALRTGNIPHVATKLSPALQSILVGLLDPLPGSRLTARQALARPYLVALARRRAARAVLRNGIRAVQYTIQFAVSIMMSWLAPVSTPFRGAYKLFAVWFSRGISNGSTAHSNNDNNNSDGGSSGGDSIVGGQCMNPISKSHINSCNNEGYSNNNSAISRQLLPNESPTGQCLDKNGMREGRNGYRDNPATGNGNYGRGNGNRDDRNRNNDANREDNNDNRMPLENEQEQIAATMLERAKNSATDVFAHPLNYDTSEGSSPDFSLHVNHFSTQRNLSHPHHHGAIAAHHVTNSTPLHPPPFRRGGSSEVQCQDRCFSEGASYGGRPFPNIPPPSTIGGQQHQQQEGNNSSNFSNTTAQHSDSSQSQHLSQLEPHSLSTGFNQHSTSTHSQCEQHSNEAKTDGGEFEQYCVNSHEQKAIGVCQSEGNCNKQHCNCNIKYGNCSQVTGKTYSNNLETPVSLNRGNTRNNHVLSSIRGRGEGNNFNNSSMCSSSVLHTPQIVDNASLRSASPPLSRPRQLFEDVEDSTEDKDEMLTSTNFTSRNLIDLFDATEFSDDE